jgi:membrane protein YdbS with pleckstrin-like domain
MAEKQTIPKQKEQSWLGHYARELRPHLLWDTIKESLGLVLAMVGGIVGLRQWLQNHWSIVEVISFWVLCLVVLAILAHIDNLSHAKRETRSSKR